MSLLKIFACGASIAVTTALAPGAQIFISNFNLYPPTPVINPGGSLIPAGSGSVSIGTFASLTSAEISAQAWTPAALVADFVPFGNPVTFGDENSSHQPGFFHADVAVANFDDPALVGEKIYLLIGDGSSHLDSTAFAVLDGGDSKRFVRDSPVFGDYLLLTSPLAEGTSLVAGRAIDSIFVPAAGEAFAGIQLVVPEPSSFTLALTGTLALAIRRRRR